MKKAFYSHLAVAVCFFILGNGTFWGVSRFLEHKNNLKVAHLETLQEDPFAQIQHMHRQIFNNFMGGQEPLLSLHTLSVNSDFKQTEDDNFVYYEIEIQGGSPKEVKVEVLDGQVSIAGKIESHDDEEGHSRFFSSTFQRSFPVPEGVDGDNFKIEQVKNKIVIKFPKHSV